jgi:hypothetical protein
MKILSQLLTAPQVGRLKVLILRRADARFAAEPEVVVAELSQPV